MPTVRLAAAAVLVLGIGGLLGGCGSSSMVGRQYDNLTAYYNKFYNANQAFENGVEAFRERERSIDRTRYLALFPAPTDRLDEAPFEDAIQKSADVLREHPNSKWVDDALLLIGKSYFYQQNYVGATQKFREVMALNTTLEPQARFWLARTLVTSGSFADAAEVLGISWEGESTTWTARMQLVQAELFVRQEQWEEAERVLERGMTQDLPEEMAARAAFLLGQVRETLGSPLEARAAYRQVQEYDPPYNLAFSARMSEIELQGTHEDSERALDRLEDLAEDDKNLDNQGAIALARARIYRAQGDRDRARQTLRRALYEEEASRPRGATEGRLHYDLAVLYRDAYKDFSRAAAHFDTASTTLQDPRDGEQSTRAALPTAPLDAGTQADQYRDLAERARDVARLDSLLRLGRMSDQEFQTFVKELRRKRQAPRTQAEEGGQGPPSRRRLGTSAEALSEQRQAQAPAAQTRESDAGFLFHRDPTRVQAGQRRFEETWGDRPLVDDWRRRVAMQSGQTSEPEREVASVPADADRGPAGRPEDASSPLDLSAIPRDSSSRTQMEADRAVARYELANSLFLAAGRPDSAATWYRRILEETGDQPVARRALYALAEAYRAQGNTTAAQQAYERLIERHPETELAAQARRRLDRSPGARRENPAVTADSTYERALRAWERDNWPSALPQFLRVAADHPESTAAPRALLATGIIYWRRAQVDSVRPPREPLERFLASLRADAPGVPGAWGGGAGGEWGALPDSSGAPSDSVDPRPIDWESLSSIRPDDAGSSVALSGGQQGGGSSLKEDSVAISDSAEGASAVQRYAPLQALLTHLTERYPETPQAERARSMLGLVEERIQPTDSVDVDSTARPIASDSAAVAATDSGSGTDPREQPPNQSRPTPSSDTTTTGATRAASSEPLPAPTGPSTGANDEGAPQTWTILVQRFSERNAVMLRMRELRQQVEGRWTVDVRRDPEAEESAYLLLVGRFDSEQQAESVREQLDEDGTGDVAVQPFDSSWRAP